MEDVSLYGVLVARAAVSSDKARMVKSTGVSAGSRKGLDADVPLAVSFAGWFTGGNGLTCHVSAAAEGSERSGRPRGRLSLSLNQQMRSTSVFW